MGRLSIRHHPFENFHYPFIRSTSSVRKFSLAVHPFDLIRSKILISRSSVPGTRFKWLCLAVRHPFACRSVQRSNGYRSERFHVRGHICIFGYVFICKQAQTSVCISYTNNFSIHTNRPLQTVFYCKASDFQQVT